MIKNRFIFATFFLAASVLTKQSTVILIPVFLIFTLLKKKLSDFILGGGLSLVLLYILYFPFQPINTIPWATGFYLKSFRGELPYLVCNAFNFWALLFGFEQRSVNTVFLGLSLGVWGILLFLVFFFLTISFLFKNNDFKNLIACAFLSSFAAFLFLPKMHERYFYTAAIFLAIMGSAKKEFFTSLSFCQ